jgi:predicted GIY-YIG superfamily endonuclease/glycine/D-amino acid oxidase-like deaminating enzyme
MYVVYILQCSDGSYYTGLSNDLDRRLWQHETGFFPKCYTYKRRPVKLVWRKFVENIEEAMTLEKQIKGWSRKKKEALINEDISELKRLSNTKKQDPEPDEGTPFVRLRAQGHVEFLIIGQGVSGTFLSYYLHKEKRSFIVIDNGNPNSPSRIAAGIINPVTGRRMVTVWMADQILPFAWNAYQSIGNELGITAISQKNIIDFFPNPFMRENFLKRLDEGNDYIQPANDQEKYRSYFNYDFGCGEIVPVYTAHLETLLPAWRKKLLSENLLLEENFELEKLSVSPEPGEGQSVTWTSVDGKSFSADKVIFCDGNNSFDNPWFKQLPFAPNKGEALVAEIPGLPGDNVYKKSNVLAPLAGENHLYWVGSSYNWEFDNADPSSAFRDTTEAALKEWLKIPFKIVDHYAGIRPATLERRPFVGLHPHQPNIGILNGMGTKGCSLAPFFAKQLVDHLLHHQPITPEASVSRFQKILSKEN